VPAASAEKRILDVVSEIAVAIFMLLSKYSF